MGMTRFPDSSFDVIHIRQMLFAVGDLYGPERVQLTLRSPTTTVLLTNLSDYFAQEAFSSYMNAR